MSKPIGKYSDLELFEALKSDKKLAEAAFAEIYARYSQRIYAYCLRVTGNNEDANDIFQDAFLKFFDAVKSTKNMTNLSAFLLIITRNLCLNYKRDKKIMVSIEDYQLLSHDKGYEQKEIMELISHALNCLDFEFREAFILRVYHGMSYEEAAEVTGDTESAIKNRVWRAKQRLKEILSPYLEEISNNK